ncbi:phosphoenolpyruvate protein kinase [archaeon]|nr:MAG: phosphoenolpyruvate protein kinase [archaeon]
MRRHCVPLSAASTSHITSIGGKAVNLAKLLQQGFPVPEGFVIPATTYERLVEQSGLGGRIRDRIASTSFDHGASVAACSNDIKAMIRSLELPEEVSSAITGAMNGVRGTNLWAVRSSAVSEDLPEASFAGQQDTFLNVPAGDVIAHVKECWASYWNERAIAYRHDARIPHGEAGVAVVVQRMVDASRSGVMFTRDPLGDRDTTVIEASWGLGESIVSGIVTPDRFICDRDRGTVRSRVINTKKKATYLSTRKTTIEDVRHDLQTAPSLTPAQVRQLVDAGRHIEDCFAMPQDVEWAIEGEDLYILQSRPITTFKQDEEVLWTRAYGDEYWADVTSPLFFSLLGHYLATYVNREGSQILGYTELTDKELLHVHKGHIYFNAGVLEQVFTYNPRFSRTKELLNYFPLEDQSRIRNAKTKVARRLLGELRVMLLDPDGSIFRTDKAYRKWAREFLASVREHDAIDLAACTDEELAKLYQSFESSFLKHYRLIRYGMVTHSIGTNLMIKRWLEAWLGDTNGVLYSSLISGLKDNKTITTNIAISQLASTFRSNERLAHELESLPGKQFLEVLRAEPAFERERGAFDAFLDEYGHRSHTREIYFPRWADDPTLVIGILRSLVSAPAVDMRKLEQERREQRIETEREILERLGAQSGGFLRKRIFKLVLAYAQTYLIFRENQRYYLDHILLRLRRLFMEFGRRYADAGLFDVPEDVFFLSKEEVFGIRDIDRDELKRTIARRRDDFERYRDVLPPKFLKGRIEFDDTVKEDGSLVHVTGTAASPGIVTGTVRVVRSIENLTDIRQGEILVTTNTDPGWTPVFTKIGGLITETGGILSHGAVVSREYRLPAVTAVKGATTLFSTGQTLTLDGNEGIIYVVEE